MVTIPINCLHCGGPVEIESAEADDRRGTVEQFWSCPYCEVGNSFTAPWRIVWVSKPRESKTKHCPLRLRP